MSRLSGDSCDRDLVFLSYSRNDRGAAVNLCDQIERQGLTLFRDEDSIREGDLWLNRLEQAVDSCGAFLVLLGRDGVNRWVGAETQVALSRHFGPRDDTRRLPIFPILLEPTRPETLPAFLRLFQATRWNGVDPLPTLLFEQIRKRTIVSNKTASIDGCPFVGLDAYRMDQARLFFGRQMETLAALASFDTRPGTPTVRWLEINGNSGSGKSSLMNAGLLPLVDQGWLWPRTGFAHRRRIGPMMPGVHPVAMLAEQLARTFGVEMADIRRRLQTDELALADWLRGRKPDGETMFLLAIDQFEELFTLADPDDRGRFDQLLAAALDDADCPLFVISTVRADFLDRFDELPRLVAMRNRVGRPWTLAPIGVEGLREIIAGPARLAGLDVSEVQEAMMAEARDEPGALPLVENALYWLWQQRTGDHLSGRRLSDQGGLAGILSHSADDLLAGLDARQRGRAMELLFRLVQVDPEAGRHTRRRISLAEAIDVAGGDKRGRDLVYRLAGERRRDGGKAAGPVRLITVTELVDGKAQATGSKGRSVDLIHETLIRGKGRGAGGKPQPFWPTLSTYIEQNRKRAARRERLQLLAREWSERKGFTRLFGLAGWSGLLGFRGLAARGSTEQRYLRWSGTSALVQGVVLATIVGVIGENLLWMATRRLPLEAVSTRWAYKLGRTLPLPELNLVPEGTFMMGDDGYPEERPIHAVNFAQSFYLGKTEVTFREWDACVADGGCDHYPSDQGWGRGTLPVINVSWQDTQAYVDWLSRRLNGICRLPTETEWEYAARAGTTGQYALPAPAGSDDITDKWLANCKGCGSEWHANGTASVGQFPVNNWGIQDTHGNVFEWVQDCRHASYEGAPDSGTAWLDTQDGDCTLRGLRGGAWDHNQTAARSASRFWLNPEFRDNDVGFRVLCSSLATNPHL